MAGVWRTSWPNSFCCAPLHAVRFDSATATRCREVPELQAACAACFSGSFWRRISTRFSPQTALGGYRVRGCQVTEKCPSNGAKLTEMPSHLRPPETPAAVTFAIPGRSPAQAPSGAGAALDGAVGTIRVDVERTGGSLDHFARDHDLLDAFQARKVEHGLEQDALEDRAQAPRAGLALDRPAGDRAKRLVGEGELDILHLEQPLVLLHQRVLRIGQNLLQRSLVEIFQGRDHRQAADEFRDQAVLQQIFRLDMAEDFAGAAVFRRQNLRREADRGRTSARGNDLLQSRESAAADEQDIGGIDLQEFLL